MSSYTILLKRFYLSRGYSVIDSTGVRVFRINGKVRFARTFVVEGVQKSSSLDVREKLLAIDPTYRVTRKGQLLARICRTTTSGEYPERYTIDLGAGGELTASGSLLSDITIRNRGSVWAKIWREQQTVRETFGFETAGNDDPALLLAIAMAIVETDSSRGRNPGG